MREELTIEQNAVNDLPEGRRAAPAPADGQTRVLTGYNPQTRARQFDIYDPRGWWFPYEASKPGRPPVYDPEVPRVTESAGRRRASRPAFRLSLPEVTVEKGMTALYVPVSEFTTPRALRGGQIVQIDKVLKRSITAHVLGTEDTVTITPGEGTLLPLVTAE